MRQTKIISAFPGTGKSYIYNNGIEYFYDLKILDSDSSEFSWVDVDGQKCRNHNFPDNYIDHIKSQIGKVDIIFVSSHKDVRQKLKENCLFYYLFFPKENLKEEYIQRYKDRGSPESFINIVSDNWELWWKSCWYDVCQDYCKAITINGYLEKEITHILRTENGES